MGKKQFLNSMYFRGGSKFDKATGKYVFLKNDALIFTVKDVETLQTELKIIPHPTIDFYIAKQHQKFHKMYMPVEELRKVTIPYSERDHAIAQCLNKLPEFTYARRNGSYWEYSKEILKNPDLYFADQNIEDYYKTKYIMDNADEETGDQTVSPRYSMCFSDTEVDISEYNESFPDPSIAPCPINLITNIYSETKECITYVLYDERVAKDQQWAVEHKDEFIKQYLDPIIVEEGLSFDIKVYAKEDDLIIDYFTDMHIRKPDYCAWWNMSFDIPTIIHRLERLGYTEEQIADIICHPEVPKQYRYVKWIPDPKRKMFESGVQGDDEDELEEAEAAEEDDGASKNSKNKPHPSRLVDTLEAPGYTQHYDQLSTFSCMRKRYLLPSYKLDDIGEQYAGIGKYDLKANGYNIKDCNVKNFLIFLAYNIRDSFVQYKLESKVRDMPQNIVCGSNTRWSKTFQMSICVKNEIMLYLMRQGQIIGNAIDYNIIEHFQGALVGLPSLIEQYGIKIPGCKKSYVYSNNVDADASSLYPAQIITHNISKDALFGRISAIYQGTTGKYLGIGVDTYENNDDKKNSLFSDIETIDISLFDVVGKYMDLPTPGELINLIGDVFRKPKTV